MASSSSCCSPRARFSGAAVVGIAVLLLAGCAGNAGAYHPGGGDMRYQFVAEQNAARASMGLAPLQWDERVASYARWYAQSRRGDCALVHSSGPYGENLFWGSGTGWAPAQAVDAWLSERPRYDYWSNSCYGGMCGHYTQIMWRTTQRVGCAQVTTTRRATTSACAPTHVVVAGHLLRRRHGAASSRLGVSVVAVPSLLAVRTMMSR